MTPRPVTIRPLTEEDLETADHIIRVAFGTFLGLTDPQAHPSARGYARSRWTASPRSAFAAELDGRLIGSNFATRWGAFAFFGPLTIDPAVQDQGYGSMLIEPVIRLFDEWDVTYTGLFTFAHSPKHIGLYQKFGFRPRSLTMIMERDVDRATEGAPRWMPYSKLDESARRSALDACRLVTGAIYPGLDVTPEIESLRVQGLGETVLLGDDRIRGFAACHLGEGSEADAGTCYIKFGAVSPGPAAGRNFSDLLAASESFASGRDVGRMVAGMNTARVEAYEAMLSEGYRVSRSGIAMHRPNIEGFGRPGVFVIDDWR